jgi:acyl transferase domain-containing protein
MVAIRRTSISEWLYVPYWKPGIVPAPQADPATWAIFGDTALSAELAARLRVRGHVVQEVKTVAGSARGPSSHSDPWTRMGVVPKRIVYCASETFDAYGLLQLIQSLDRHEFESLALTIVTRGAEQIFDNDMLDPAQAALLGASLVVPQEYPDITCRRIDVSLPEVSWQAELLYENLIAELTATATEATIAYRGGRRWIQTFQPIAAPDGAPTVLRAGGVYLFTGGFGRIARTLARHLAQTVRAKLVLLSRQSLPPRGCTRISSLN